MTKPLSPKELAKRAANRQRRSVTKKVPRKRNAIPEAKGEQIKGNAHWDMSLRDVIKWWDTIDRGGVDLAGIRALCLVDRFYLLVKVCKRADMLHPWIYARCREVEKKPDDHLDLWAREHYKSTIITFGGAIQEILKDPEISICIFSHIGAIASDFLRQIKVELESNLQLKAAFPDVLWADPSKEAQRWSVEGGLVVKRKTNPKEATLEASGLVDGQPVSKHYRLRIYDDVVTDRSVNTFEQITKTTNAYSLSQSLSCEGGREWGVGTRYNFQDTYQWILDRQALTARTYAATVDGQVTGEPVLFTPGEWKKRRQRSTDSDLACQYMQNPLAGQQAMFDADYLQTYEVRPEAITVYVMCDPARSKKKDSDNTAIIVIGVDYAHNKFLLDGFNHKMDLGERWRYFSRMYIKWKQAAGVQVVKMGYERYGADADLDYFNEQMKKPDSVRFEITELEWPREGPGSKIDRVQRLTPDLKEGKLYLPYPTKENALTSLQRKMMGLGYGYRVSKRILRKDENGNAYDLTEHLRLQFQLFPHGAKKDAIDALSRIYDMEPRPPNSHDNIYAEPEFT